MKLNDPRTEFEGSLPQGTRLTFQLKSNPKMFQILSDGIYADKIMAVIRELSCNARDSNVVAGTKAPFKVNVPTSLESNFWVEDTGLGIDPDKIVDIFWTYGASTKTDSNDTIGALGLGSKSPFAYTKSSFLVINRFNGMEYKYFCFINEAGIPDGKLMYQSATDQPNGVRVELAVRLDDISSFRSRIVRFFSFWDIAAMPDFHGDSSVKDAILKLKAGRKLRGKSWELRSSEENLGQGAFAVMGGVPYPINRNSLPTVSRALDTVCRSYANITFPMGTLNFQVSREELSYDDATIAALEKSAKVVCDEILAEATKKLVGHKTPHELAVAYRATYQDLRRSFEYVAQLLGNQSFKLADGREFKAGVLTNNYVRASAASHTAFDILRVVAEQRDYSKGTQYYGLNTLQRVTVLKPEVRDPVTHKVLHGASDNTIDYFKPNTLPAPQTNPNRKRTAANYLHAGYKPTETKFETGLHSGLDAAFIVNDIGDRGAEGMRFYKGGLRNITALEPAYNNGNLLFIDGYASGKTPVEIEAEVREFLKGTLLEGVTFTRLSSLPNFKLPEAPKVTPKARAPAQRGTIEQRLLKVFFKKPTPKDSYTIEHVEDFELRLDVARKVKPEYARHELIKPLLYIETNWGNPTGALEKAAVVTETLAALKMLGLLDRFIDTTVPGDEAEMHIGFLSPNQVTECKDRKIELVSFKELFEAAVKLMQADTELTDALKLRPAGNDYDDENRTLRYMMSKKMKAVTLQALRPTNMLVQLANVHGKIQGLLKGSPRRHALMYMTFKAMYDTLPSAAALSAGLTGKTNVKKLLKTYPLLEILATLATLASVVTSSSDDGLYQHLAMYINSVDDAVEQAAEKAKLAELAALHAEALFEAC